MCNDIKKIKCTPMKCHTNDNSTSSTQLPHKFSYIVAILGHNHFVSPNMLYNIPESIVVYLKSKLGFFGTSGPVLNASETSVLRPTSAKKSPIDTRTS
jgi:hypothetical protein